MSLMSLKLIQTALKNVIVKPKNHVTNLFFTMSLVIGILKESAKSKRTG